MKKLKCESCGGDIEIDEGKNLAVCPFCQTKYQLNEKKEIYIRVDEDIKKMTMDAFERNKKVSKVITPIFIVIFVAVFGFIAFNIFKMESGTSEFDIRRYNNKFDFYKGTQSKHSISTLIDNIVTNNKTDKKKITVVFEELETTDPDKIVDIKKSLKDDFDSEYEIKFDYDKKGFINKVIIEEILKEDKNDHEEENSDDFDEQMENAKDMYNKAKEKIDEMR